MSSVTSYTAFIKDGRCTSPKQFLHLCMRAFGLFQNYYDESLSLDFKPDFDKKFDSDIEYEKKQLQEAEDEYLDFKNTTREVYIEDMIKENSEELARLEELIKDNDIENAKFDKFINAISSWKCSPEFDNLKKFAIEQCTISTDDNNYYIERIAQLKDRIEHASEKYDEECASLEDYYQRAIKRHTERIEELKKLKQESIDFYNKFLEEISDLD